MRHADRIFRNTEDTKRGRVFHREDGRWDFDLFHRHVIAPYGYHVEEGWCGCSTTRTQKDAIAWLEDLGLFHEIRGGATVTEGWPERVTPKPTKDAAVEIRAGQVWRQGSRRLRVEWVAAHWRIAGEHEVGYIWIDDTGRERGSAIVGRRARQRAHEERFRAKFRYVSEAV